MISKILTDTITDEDIAEAQAYNANERARLLERLTGTLEEQLADAVLLEDVMEDVANALQKARPVFAAGLSVDQALGFIVKLVEDSVEELAQAGAQDSAEFEKQELVLEKLNGIVDACKEVGMTEGEEAQEAAHLEYRGEVGVLDAKKNACELGIASSIDFVNAAFGEAETASFVKNLEHDNTTARYLSKFGSPSFFKFKHVVAPGQTYDSHSQDKEGD